MTSPDQTAPDSDLARVEAAAQALLAARQTGTSIASLGDNSPQTAAHSHAIDDRVAALLGEPVRGWKIGCTSEYAQQILGTDGPISGRVYEVLASGAELDVADARLHISSALLEGEMAVTLGADLVPQPEPFSREEVKAAVDTLHPAIEIVGGRMADFLNTPIRTVEADAGGNCALVLGSPFADWRSRDLTTVEATMTVAGTVTGSGTGADVLGHPFAALQWLANDLSARGIALRAGQVVTTGTCTQVTPAVAGTTATVSFAGLGEAAVTFS